MNENNQQSGNSAIESGKGYKKHVLAFFAVLLVVGGGYFAWSQYLSSEVVNGREQQANYQKYVDWQNKYEAAMTADTYGGKTPEETLQMFIDALKKGDVELASKYFLLNESGEVDQKWADGLRQAKERGRLSEIIKELESARPAGSSMKDYFGFEIRSADGEIISDINMILNRFSNIWKIESL